MKTGEPGLWSEDACKVLAEMHRQHVEGYVLSCGFKLQLSEAGEILKQTGRR